MRRARDLVKLSEAGAPALDSRKVSGLRLCGDALEVE
jgi:hypothetical protein